MAGTSDNNKPGAGDPKKESTSSNPRMSEIQRRAAAMARGDRKPVSMQQFFSEAWVELQKTTWPSKDVLTKSTTVVLAFVLAVAIWVGVEDYLLTKILVPLFG